MSCTAPLTAYKSQQLKTDKGKALVFFKPEDSKGLPYEIISLPCGQCITCRLTKSQSWALRIMHEASLYKTNSFLTLTYRDASLPSGESLNMDHPREFMRTFRRDTPGQTSVHWHKNRRPIRYLQVGEYGDEFDRPHYHLCLFNFDPQDKVFIRKTKSGEKIYSSEYITRYWPHGDSYVGTLTHKSAAYVARYCLKKLTGPDEIKDHVKVDPETGECWFVEPPKISMSNRPGIGKAWFDKFKTDCFPSDYLIYDNRKYPVPKYYDRLLEQNVPTELETIKKLRRIKAEKNKRTTQQRYNKNLIAEKRAKRLKRS